MVRILFAVLNTCRRNGFRLRVLPSQTKRDLDPNFLFSWDTGGKTPPIHYRCRDGSVRDIPSTNEPFIPGHGVWRG
jgi:hypothetical protein